MQIVFRFFAYFFLILFTSILNAAPQKNWTFLIFLNGNNSLDSFGQENIKSMEQIGSDDQVNVVVQWASQSARRTVRMLIQKSTDPNKVTSPVLQEMGVVDMGDVHSLQDFILWGVQNFPADHYFIDVWNHGSGWHAVRALLPRTHQIFNDISWDDISGHVVTTEQLGKAMQYAAKVIGHKVDIYGSDACLMAMAEVAAEMGSSVNYFAGSEELEPGNGWPYADLLKRWEETTNATPEQVSKILVDEYVKAYQGGSYGFSEVTFSAFNLNALNEFNAAVTNFGKDLINLKAGDKSKLLAAVKKSLKFATSDYVDFQDALKNISSLNIKDLNKKDLTQLQNSLSNLILANAATNQYKRATGLAVWFPTSKPVYNRNRVRYKGLVFQANTGWGDTLAALLNA